MAAAAGSSAAAHAVKRDSINHAPHANHTHSWQKVFDRFDADGSGVLDCTEVQEALRVLLGTDVPPESISLAMTKLDRDKSGSIDIEEFGILVAEIRACRKAFVEPPIETHAGSILGKNRKIPFQDKVLFWYNNKIVVTVVACCIVGNFIINILEKQIDPDPNKPKYESFWAAADFVFNLIFIVELAMNMWGYGGPTRRFWSSGWNVFDTIIVIVGVLTMANVLGPPLDKLKLMRAFRVFRLFKRIESLNKIIVALLNSIPGVLNAFFVMFIFFCIYAILAVELFREFGEGGVYYVHDSTTGTNVTIDAISSRGYVHGIEYYGTFMRALYTLFQVMTGESWSEAVVRPLLFGLYENSAWTVGFFFVSFIILTQTVLINVVIAVLLDKFSEAPDDAENAALETRLASLDHKEISDDISSKLDKLIGKMEKLDTIDQRVTDLATKMAKFDKVSLSVAKLENDVCHIRTGKAMNAVNGCITTDKFDTTNKALTL